MRLKGTDGGFAILEQNGRIIIKLTNLNNSKSRIITTTIQPTGTVGVYASWDAETERLTASIYTNNKEYKYVSASNVYTTYKNIQNFNGRIIAGSYINSYVSPALITQYATNSDIPIGSINYLPGYYSETGYPIKDSDNTTFTYSNSVVDDIGNFWYDGNKKEADVISVDNSLYAYGSDINWVPIGGISELPDDSSAYNGAYWKSPRWPLVGSLPVTVVDGQSLRIAGGGEFGTEYIGVGGAWVAQASVTMQLWQSNGTNWLPIGYWLYLGGESIEYNNIPLTSTIPELIDPVFIYMEV